MNEGILKIICPPMYVRHQSFGLAITDSLDAIWNLSFSDRKTIGGIITFPPSPIRVQGGPIPIHWLVDSCIAKSHPNSKDSIVLTLPPEPCRIDFCFHDGLYMLVESITAKGEIRLEDGSIGKVSIIFPQCKSRWKSLGLWQVDAVDALGTVEIFDTPGSI